MLFLLDAGRKVTKKMVEKQHNRRLRKADMAREYLFAFFAHQLLRRRRFWVGFG